GSGILRSPPGESSLILQGFFTHRPARCCGGVALSMEAHYREFARRGKPPHAIKLQKTALFQLFITKHSFYTNLSTEYDL
ncbi:hypothetical protein, partial [Aeromonas schubertii]|uniref:hypothetical protein n=1 Tax=Aeromonas schubertii TaxID=652 RepID=UPI001E51FC53